MAQYYRVQSIGGEDMKPIYTTADIVLHVASDDVGVSNPNQAQPIHLDENQQLLLQNDQVVYQTHGTPTQYQPPQAGTHYTILGEDMSQPQAQQVLQQPQQQQQQVPPPPPQHQQQQVLIHQQQQQQQTQQHSVMDIQQHQMQTAYQMTQDAQQHMQAAQEHQLQHVQQSPQQPPQQLYYSPDQLVHQQQQKKVYIQQVPQQNLQQQYQPHAQQQAHQQMLHQQQPPPQSQQQQQHILQSSQHPQVQVQHQVSPSSQQQASSQIIYRMQQQSTQLLGNAQLIVQQPSGQQVLIQQQPQQQELIMRQQMPQQRVLYNNQRLMYAPQQQTQQQQQQTIMQQANINLQTNVMHHNPTTTHLVQQARVVPSQHQQQVQQQNQTPPPQQQQMQQSVVYQQIQVPKQNMPQSSALSQQQQHLQLQQLPQSQQMPNGTTIIRAPGLARGIKIPRGALTTRMPGGAGGIPRAAAFNTSASIAGGGGQTLRTPRPRCSTSASGTTGRVRGGKAGRGSAATLAAGRGIHVAAGGAGAIIMPNNPQLATLQQTKIVTQGQAGIRQVYRTQIADSNMHQQVQLAQSQPRMPGAAARFKTPVIGVQQQQSHHSPQQSPPSASNTSGNGSGGGNYDLEDRIQAVFVKKDGQKQAAAVGVGVNQTVAPNSSVQAAGTTLTTYYTAKDDDDSRLIKTQNGCMSLAEYKKRTANNQIPPTNPCIKSLPPNPGSVKISVPTVGPPTPVGRAMPQKVMVAKEQGASTPTPSSQAAGQATNRPPAGSSVYQTSHNNYEIQTQHVLQNRAGQQMAEKDRNSAKMLVILVSGEQRLITFTLPRESCTVQDLLEQVGVPFDDNTTIQCVEKPGADIDFVVTVGFSVQESASELISRAEQSLQISRQQESLQQNPSAATTAASGASTTGSASAIPSGGISQNSSSSTSEATTAIAATANPTISTQSDSTAKELQSVNATRQTPRSSSPGKGIEEATSQRKLIQGFYAICQSCGFSGYDHSKCERCKRVFHEPPKKVAIKQAGPPSANTGCLSNSSSSASSESSSSTSSMPMDKKRHGFDGLLSLSQRSKSSAHNPNGPVNRGRGVSQGGRGRGNRSGRRLAEVEPVILTLSSDEEDEDSSNKGMPNYGSLLKSANPTPTTVTITYKPFAFESNIPDPDESLIYNDFKRDDVTDLSDCTDKLSCSLHCKLIRIGSYRFEPAESVIITSKGINIIAPLETNQSETFPLHIHKKEVVKVIGNFSKTSDSMLCFYTLRNCAEYIRNSLKLHDIAKPLDGVTYFSANGPNQMRKIIIQFPTFSEQSKNVIRSIWEFLDEISDSDAQDLLQRAAESDKKLASSKSNSDNVNTTTQLQPNEIRQLLIYPPGKGGISINTEDYMCLATDQYLNDIIIDFYLKWVHDHIIPEAQKPRTHMFSTFFYKRLTTLTRHTNHDKDVKQTAAQKRHARVQNWTKNVNLFEKDFIIIPINEQSHWFLAIICFPRLKGPVTFDTGVPVELQPVKKTKGKKVSLQIGNTTITPLSKRESGNVLNDICNVGDEDSERDEAEGDESDLASEESDMESSSFNTSNNSQPPVPLLSATTGNNSAPQAIKQPLILIFDSLAGASRSRVVATLRDYLSCEYKAKMPESALHTFNKDNMPGHCVKVPQQNNFTDCGLYLLQYVEQFFKDPIRDYKIPIKQLADWFDTLTVTKKREDISNLLQKLMNERNGPNNKIILPEIPFPTVNGVLVEPDGFNIEFEEEEMEEDDDEDNQTGDMDDASTDDTSKNKTPVKIPPTPPSSTSASASTLPALVPAQARKIVLKRRMQVLGTAAPDVSPQQIGNSSNSCTAGTIPTPPQNQLQRPPSMSKIRKVDP